MPSTQSEIIKADAPYRRRLFSIYLAVIVLGFAAWRYVVPPCLDAFKRLAPPDYFAVAETATIIFLLLFIIPAVFLIRTGTKIISSGRFPTPGMKVLHDTKIVTGRGALFRGRALVRLGWVSIGFAVAGSVAMHLIFMYIHASPILSHMPLF